MYCCSLRLINLERAMKKPIENIGHALSLDGSPEALKEYYAKWAQTYDADLVDKHHAPQVMADLVMWQLRELYPDKCLADFNVLDVGCGTGMLGVLLKQAGFVQLDGNDLSAEMIEKAQHSGAYRQLTANIDVNLDTHVQWNGHYDLVTCVGVFTLGHVMPESLINMIRFAKPGGLIVTSTRLAYYEQTHIQQVHDQLEADGLATLIHSLKDAPYTNDSNGHFWVFQRIAL